ncbi:MAG TPA: AMP-binding protein [Streptosporangiaceae bacterium]|nr:AMP-binding protein [Streptosporangiaceae bacterium]
MVTRPLHAVLLPPDRMLGPLAAALDGSGPAILPLDPALPAGRLRRLLDELAPDAVLTGDGLDRLGRSSPGHSLGAGEDVAVVIATSGSTGEPKGVELSAAALLGSARASLQRIGAAPGDRWLCCLPVSHIAGLQVLIRSLVAGSTPVVAGRLGPGVAASADGAHVSMVPTQLHRLVEAGASLSSFGIILVGGAGVAPALITGARAAGGRVVTTYGMTETCGGCVYDGEPLDGVRVAVRTPTGGEGGLVAISGPVLFSGYRRQPGLTAAVLDNGWFTTSDLGSIDASGRLVIRGRADDVINTGGQKVAGGEVAAVLEACDSVRQAVVVGRPDPEWGERVTAIVVPADPAAPPDLALVRAHVRRSLPAAAAPREIVVVDEIPLLPSGKPDVWALRHDGQETVDVPGTIVASERYY